jgi:hypothetical protein
MMGSRVGWVGVLHAVRRAVAKSGSWCGLRAAKPVVLVSIGLCRGCFSEARFAAAMERLDATLRQRYGLDQDKEDTR